MRGDELIEIEAIKQLKARYFRFLDEKRWDEWGGVFTEDAKLDNTADGAGVVTGRGPIVAFVSSALEGTLTVHQGHMPEIEITGTGAARGIWAMEDIVEFPNGTTLEGRGHYREEYAKGPDDQWRIAHLILTRLRVRMSGPPPEAPAGTGGSTP